MQCVSYACNWGLKRRGAQLKHQSWRVAGPRSNTASHCPTGNDQESPEPFPGGWAQRIWKASPPLMVCSRPFISPPVAWWLWPVTAATQGWHVPTHWWTSQRTYRKKTPQSFVLRLCGAKTALVTAVFLGHSGCPTPEFLFSILKTPCIITF